MARIRVKVTNPLIFKCLEIVEYGVKKPRREFRLKKSAFTEKSDILFARESYEVLNDSISSEHCCIKIENRMKLREYRVNSKNYLISAPTQGKH